MGIVRDLFGMFFGSGKNVIAETAEVFRVNKEKEAQRTADYQAAALSQFGTEFAHDRKGWFDRFIDGLNRIPRPAMALGTLGLIVSAMVDPVWFGSRMEGLALVPEPLWWLLGAIVSFYFGARHQMKGQEFQASFARSAAATRAIQPETPPESAPETPDTPGAADTRTDVELQARVLKIDTTENAALAEWLKIRNK